MIRRPFFVAELSLRFKDKKTNKSNNAVVFQKVCLVGGIRFFRYANIAIPGFGATRCSVSLSFLPFSREIIPGSERSGGPASGMISYPWPLCLSAAVQAPCWTWLPAWLPVGLHEKNAYICICMGLERLRRPPDPRILSV